ncbi:cytochrome P450 [Xylariaceae sp. FL0016]|nr:cytochrome P450 [Xylariaceae sp. FL0016]
MDSLYSSPYALLAAYLSLIPISLAIYRLYFHPLANVPGPRLAAITSFWYACQVQKGQMGTFSVALHKKYGPAVRIRPDEVSFDTKEAMQTIYSGSQWIQKGDFYYAQSMNPGKIDWRFRRHKGDDFAINGELDPERYRGHRKNIGVIYSASSVKKYSERLDAVMHRLIAKIRANDEAVCDLTDWVHFAVVECLGAMTLNWSPGFIEDTSSHGHLNLSTQWWRQSSVFGMLPSTTLIVQKWPILKPIISRLLGVNMRTPEGHVPFHPRVVSLIKQRASAFFAAIKSKPETPLLPAEPDMLSELLQQTQKKDNWKPHFATSMAAINFLAGHETTTTTAAWSLLMINSSPEVKARVQAETTEHGDDFESCKFTQACIKEAQRVHPIGGLSFPRLVPAGAPLTLHGHVLPPGTTVGVNLPAMDINPRNFGPDAAEYKPERWLESPETWRDLEKNSLAWGGGAHTCPGRNVAELILGKLITALMREFDIEVVRVPAEKERRSITYIGFGGHMLPQLGSTGDGTDGLCPGAGVKGTDDDGTDESYSVSGAKLGNGGNGAAEAKGVHAGIEAKVVEESA